MSVESDGGVLEAQCDVMNTMQKSWGWILALGIVSVVLGMVALVVPMVVTLGMDLFIGCLLLIGGIAQLIHTFGSRGWDGPLLRILMGILSALAGVILLTRPLTGILTLTILLAAFFIVNGVFKIILALQLRPGGNWVWALVDGIVVLVLGVLIYAEWPQDAQWVIGLLVGIGLIFSGWTWVMLALGVRGMTQRPVSPDAE